MKKNKHTHRFASLAAALIVSALGVSNVMGQNFTNNTGGTYNAGTNGKIVMKKTGDATTSGKFDGTAQLGLSASRIPGTVEWAGAAGQYIQGLYYSHLLLSGAGAKTVMDNVYVFNTYSAAGGSRTYNGTFFYDGTGAQTIFGEAGSSSGTDRYNNLNLLGGGAKTVAGADKVYADGNLTKAANTDLTVNGGVIIGRGATPLASDIQGNVAIDGAAAGFTVENTDATFAGNVNLRNGGATAAKFTVDGSGNVALNGTTQVETTGGGVAITNGSTGAITVGTTGSLLLDNNANAKLDLGTGTHMTVTGTFTNNFAAATNMTYGAGSNVTYNGGNGQSIVTTVQTNPYANLTINNGGTKSPATNTANHDIYVNEAFALGNAGNGTLLDMATNSGTLNMTTGAANYTDYSEVIGKMKRSGIANSTNYAFNNESTIVNFATAPSTSFQMDIHPGTTNPSLNISAPAAGYTDVKRKITVTSVGANQGNIASLQVGYLASEYSGARESYLRFIEGYNATNRGQKITTGVAIAGGDRVTSGTFHSIKINGGILPAHNIAMITTAPGLNYEVGQGSDIVLADEPNVFNSIASGRWSNPATWDEGIEPGSADEVVIKSTHQVHAGFTRTAGDNYQIAEAHAGPAGTLAQKVTIETDAALIFGQVVSQGGQSPTNTFKLTSGATITNAGTSSVVSTSLADLNTLVGTGLAFPGRGIINYEGSIFGAYNLVNSGAVHNGGNIEIGE